MTNEPQIPPPAAPLDYAGSFVLQGEPEKKGFGRTLGVVLAVVVVVCFLLLFRSSGRPFTTIPYSEFDPRLKTSARELSNVPDRIEWLRLSDDVLYGKFVKAEDIPELAQPVTYFKVHLPSGMGRDYAFFKDVVGRIGLARLDVEPVDDGPVVRILLPLIPWLLIFGFIYFFVARPMKKRHRGAQILITGPGRWIPESSASEVKP